MTRWNLPLNPDDNTDVSLPSAPGIVKNFTWKLTGLPPSPPESPFDPADPNIYYGADILMALYGSPPTGSQFQFTLTPQVPLVDGSTGQARVFKRTVDSSDDLSGALRFTFAEWKYNDSCYLEDIPLGVYSLAVAATDPNGTALSLQFDYGGNGHKVQWSPNDISGIDGLRLTVTVGS